MFLYYRSEREMEAAWQLYHVADRAVATVAATTWAGVLAKLRLHHRMTDEGSVVDDLVPSAIADADRLLAARVVA